MAAHYDYNYEFSAGRRAAAFLRSGGFVNADTLVATYPSLCATSILPYLPRSFRFCQPEYDDFGSFMTWNTKWAENNTLPTDEIIRRVDRAAKKRGYTTVLLIMVPPVQATSSFRKIYSLIAAFGPTIVADESYCVFRLDPSKPASPTAGALK